MRVPDAPSMALSRPSAPPRLARAVPPPSATRAALLPTLDLIPASRQEQDLGAYTPTATAPSPDVYAARARPWSGHRLGALDHPRRAQRG
jgi:hypothetical protein